jgi:mRNA interferase HicA
VRGSEFIKKIEKYGKARNVSIEFVPERGKGSHGMLYHGDKGRTTIPDPKRELKTGTMRAMLKQLGINPKDFF